MKQLLLLLVLVNLGYPLLQWFSGNDVAQPAIAAQSANAASLIYQELAPGISSSTPAATRGEIAAGLPADGNPTPAADGASQSAAAPSVAAALVAVAAPTQPLETPATPPASCVIAGPFRRQRDADALVKQLANADIKARRQPRDIRLLPDYMVYVGPQASRREAQALEARFKARKMDSHIIASGDLQNALSLGVFSRGSLAQSLHQQLKKEGFNASIATMTRDRRGFQVRAALPQLIRARLVEADTPMIDCPAIDAPGTSLASAS